MALTLETGAGIAGADTYVDLATASTLILEYEGTAAQTTWDALATADAEMHLRVAAQYADGEYGHRYIGQRAYAAQGLLWPRVSLDVDAADGEYLDKDTIPEELQLAQALLAYRNVSSALQPDVAASVAGGELIEDTAKVGSLATTKKYSASSTSATSDRFPKVTAILRPLIGGGTAVVRLQA